MPKILKQLHELLGVEQNVSRAFMDEVVAAIIVGIKAEKEPNEIKAFVIQKVLADHINATPNECALIGIMVEHAYNAAVLLSQHKPLFNKKR